MLFDTVGFNQYKGFVLPMSVRNGISDLNREEAKYYYKIIYIKSGTCHFKMNENEFILTGSCVICMNEKDKLEFMDIKADAIKTLWLRPTVVNHRFTFEFMNNPARCLNGTEHQDLYYLLQFLPGVEASMKILSLHTVDSSQVEHKLHLIEGYLAKQESGSWPCKSRAYLFEILFCLARQEEDEGALTSILAYEGKPRLAVDVIYYLQSCYNQKITIEMLAEEFHTNRTTLLNDFKKYTGQSVNNYLIQLRVMMASTLLRDTELLVEEICERTGFSDISYFSKVFKKRIFCTPSEYRKLHQYKY